ILRRIVRVHSPRGGFRLAGLKRLDGPVPIVNNAASSWRGVPIRDCPATMPALEAVLLEFDAKASWVRSVRRF
ncbi:MAG: hypothetical protein ABSB67_10095, partial [Bryobacteraceae bacterium]